MSRETSRGLETAGMSPGLGKRGGQRGFLKYFWKGMAKHLSLSRSLSLSPSDPPRLGYGRSGLRLSPVEQRHQECRKKVNCEERAPFAS